MKNFDGNVLFLDRADINTDEIIPAKYLTENDKAALKPHLLEDLRLDGFAPGDLEDKQVIVTRSNFGCGSSREHAVWALEENGIRLVVAESYARIFKRNMCSCGLLAVELPADQIQGLFDTFAGQPARAALDLEGKTLHIQGPAAQQTLQFTLSTFDLALVEAGGWIDYADKKY